MSKKRIAIIGTGGIAKSHVVAIEHEKDRAELIAAVDINQEAVSNFCAKYDIKVSYTDVAEMLEKEKPDIVLVCTPPQSHAALCIQCMEAGCWVICEKPLAASLKEIDAISEAEKRTGQYTSSIYQWRFGAGANHLKELIDSGSLGRPLLGLCQTTWYRSDAYYAVPWRGKWETELGGCSMIHGIHAMDFFLWMYGPWQEVTGQIDHLNHDIEVEDVSLALVRFENSAMGSIMNSVVSPRSESYLRMDFEEATVELKHLYTYENKDWTFSIFNDSTKTKELEAWRQLPEEVPSLHAGQLGHTLDCLEQGKQPITSGYGARMTLEFIASMYKSALTGQPVKRGSIVEGDPFYESMNGDMAI